MDYFPEGDFHGRTCEPRADLAAIRARAVQTLETVFSLIVLLSATAALLTHQFADNLALPGDAARMVALAFLAIAVGDLALLLACRAWLTRDRH